MGTLSEPILFLKLKKVRFTVSIPHLFYFPGTPRYCGLKYLSKSGDISNKAKVFHASENL
jgi:hypothetical protein